MLNKKYVKGKGAQKNPKNPYLKYYTDYSPEDGLDELSGPPSRLIRKFYESPKKVVSKINSPDLPMMYSVNPYQGCEHGCVYCYARNSHQYWGFNAGQDFETNIIIKRNVARQLEIEINRPSWKVFPIALSGNTDCYQPVERKEKLTRSILEVLLKYHHPVGIITKNTLIERDLDIIREMASYQLVHVYFSITSLDDGLRQKMEPRTATSEKKFRLIEKLSSLNIPVGIMNAPIIPGLNHHEIPDILKKAAEAGARSAGYTIIRLNGSIGDVFSDWLEKNFPERKNKVLHQIQSMHGGQINDSEWGRRMTGSGGYASIIRQLFEKSKTKYFRNKKMPPYNLDAFRRGGNLSFFS